jgi:arsenite methyltransferase
MSGYLSFTSDLADPATVSAYDELPLWSAMAGLLLLQHVPLRPGLRVLDVGCGTGFPAIELAERLGPGSQVHGLDPWAGALTRARAKAAARGVAQVSFEEGNAGRMPYGDRSFDLVVSNLGLNNLPDPDAALAEVARVLAPDGVLALSTNLQGHMAEFYTVFAQVLAGTGAECEPGALARHVAHRASVDSLSALLVRCGFRTVKVAQAEQVMRFANGRALLDHWFIKLGFLEGWRACIAPEREAEVFARLEQAFGETVRLTVPFAYVEARRA